MQKLTDRQRMVLDFICSSIDDRGYPPTLREIGMKLGIRSTNGVNDHLRALERKGYLTREDMKSRTLRPTQVTRDLLGGPDVAARPAGLSLVGAVGGKAVALAKAEAAPANGAPAYDDDLIEIPILGRVAAGALHQAIEERSDTVRIDRMMLGFGGGRGHGAGANRDKGGDVFGLRISGDSMIEAGIHDRDYVFVRKQPEAPKGAIVIAMVGDEATCKYYFPESSHIRLQPANREYAPILISKHDWRETHILGVVVGVFRRL
jgi:repressor LexA